MHLLISRDRDITHRVFAIHQPLQLLNQEDSQQ